MRIVTTPDWTLYSQIATVARRWQEQNNAITNGWLTPEHERIYNRLLTLDTATATPADVAAIIGNDTWITMRPQCSQCKKYAAALAEFDHYGEYGDLEFCRLCATCLQAALDGVKAAGG